VGTQPAQLVRAPSGGSLYARLAVTGAQNTLLSYLSGGVLPTLAVPGQTGPGGNNFVFKGVVLQSETDPGTAQVRYTDDGQTAPTTTLGFVIPGQPSAVTIMCDPQDIKLIASAGTINVQCYLIIGAVSTGAN